ncbi:MAG: C4-dicarboxylic acid transporter DauA [Pseudomonadales bacterium]|nr:C4-dicarboxylic acid transporter DauA [Pseudomonadales bacterium]
MFSAVRESLQTETRPDSLKANLLSGLTVGVIALPLSMALAIAVGVPPQHGLYTAIFAGLVIALTGGSRVNISGPTAAFVVVLLPIVHAWGIGGLLVSGFMAGVILVLMGMLRLGRFVEIVPYPVTIGFTSGIGVVIATFQITDFLGLTPGESGGHYLEKLSAIVLALPTLNWQETLTGVVTLATLVFWSKLRSRIPGHLVALLVGSLLAMLLGYLLDDFSVATIGSRFHYEINGVTGSGIPPLLPAFEWPWNLPDANGEPVGMSFGLVSMLLASAITIAMLGALESLLCAVVADGMSGYKHNPDDELIGQGIGNMIVPLFGGIPATAAIARTAANIRAGATSPLSSAIHGLFIVASILFLSPLLAWIPMASMAALLLMVAWNMSEVKHFIRIVRIAPRDDVATLLICFSLTVVFDMTIAVAVGVGLASMLFIRRSIQLVESKRHESALYQDLPREIVVYNMDGPLFFGSAQQAIKGIADIMPEVRAIILDMTDVTMLDITAIIAMEGITKKLADNNVRLVICHLQPRMIQKLQRAGIGVNNGPIVFVNTADEAVDRARELVADATV